LNDINEVLSANILKLRRSKGFTQEELANKLGVTFQAVSKWENAKSAPDISLLPLIAEVFSCSIDDLFSYSVCHSSACIPELPWEDDDTIRVFQTVGKHVVAQGSSGTFIEVRLPGRADESTRQYFRVEVLGNMISDASINGDVVCHGNLECSTINGDVDCLCNVNVHSVNGNVNSACAVEFIK